MVIRMTSLLAALAAACCTPVLADTLHQSSTPPLKAGPAAQFATVTCPPQVRVAAQSLPPEWQSAPTMLSLSHGYILDSRPDVLYCYYKENVLVTRTVRPGSCKLAPNRLSFICVP